MKISQKAREAVLLGVLCSTSYLAVYIARNVLGAVTPKMTADGYSLTLIGEITAAYLLAYALGQLINGAVGNRVKAKYMMSLGLLSAGLSGLLFVYLLRTTGIAIAAYAWTGFSLSMVYAPMTRVVSESVELAYATRCSLGYTFASLLGSPAAGVLATFFTWQVTFNISSAALVLMAVTVFAVFCIFERKGIVKYVSGGSDGGADKPKKSGKELFKRNIVKFSAVAMITGVIRTSLVGFLSTYFYEYLGYSEQAAASVFSVATLFIALSAFIAVFIYERLGRNVHVSLFIFFSVAAAAFGALYFVTPAVPNIIITVIAVIAADCASTMIWSVYCPSMADTGLVSGITGYLDFMSYIAAALGSLLIPKIVSCLGWRGVIAAMLLLMLVGAAISVPALLTKRRPSTEEG